MARLSERGRIALGWAVFAAVVVAAWDVAAAGARDILNEATDPPPGAGAQAAGPPVRRTFLLALALYTQASAWFNALFLLLLVTVGTVLCMTALNGSLCGGASAQTVQRVVQLTGALPLPTVLSALELQHLGFHAATALLLVLLAALPCVMWYVRDEDLRRREVLRAKWSRLVSAMVLLSLVACAAYAAVLLAAGGK